jgi:cellulose synthase/poly-beta-1,6-N-acetylglucosamine synthase-like glycosyltransferase
VVLSVVIPALNEEMFIGHCLSALAGQTLGSDKFEVILVDNGSTDRTREITAKFESCLNLRVLEAAKGNISALRNQGASVATGSFLAFLDADCFPNSTWLADAMQLLRLGDGGVVGAFYTIPDKSHWVAKAWYGEMATMRSGRVSYVPSGNLFVSRNLFLRLGGFAPAIQTSEDFEFCQRVKTAGYGVQAIPNLSVVHAGTPQTLGQFYRKQRWHGNGVRTAFLRDIFDRAFARTVALTACIVLSLLISVLGVPVAIVMSRHAVMLIGPGFLLGGAIALATRAAIIRRRSSLVPPLTILYLSYGLARAMSLIGLDGQRSARPTPGQEKHDPWNREAIAPTAKTVIHSSQEAAITNPPRSRAVRGF